MDARTLFRSNTSAVAPIQGIVSLVLIWALLVRGYTWEWLIPLGVYFCTGCLGITMTFHRFLTHKSFRLSKPLEYLFSLFGALGGTGSPLGWVSLHKAHHVHADTELDPHSPVTRKWRVLFGSYRHDFDKWPVRHLVTDRFHRFVHDWYFAILLGWAILLGTISVDALVLGFLIPVGIQIWVSNLSNYFNHHRGTRHFETPDRSCNVWWLGWLGWGEGWHNLHHRWPSVAKFGLRWYEIDVTYWMIRLFGHRPKLLTPAQRALARC